MNYKVAKNNFIYLMNNCCFIRFIGLVIYIIDFIGSWFKWFIYYFIEVDGIDFYYLGNIDRFY